MIHTSILAKDLYVISNSAKLLDSPSMDAATLFDLDHGTKVTVKDTQDFWIKVQFKRNSGWIHKFSLADENPLNKSIIKEIDKINLNKVSRKRASAYSTAASTRGITNTDQQVTTTLDYQSVKSMEELRPKMFEVSNFKSEGGLKR